MDRKYGLSLDIGSLLKKESAEQPKLELVDAPVEPKKHDKTPTSFVSKIEKNLFWIFLIFLIVSSVFVLSQPASLYNIDVKVEGSLVEQYRTSSLSQVDMESPGLSRQQKNRFADRKVSEFVQSEFFADKVSSISGQYKQFYRDASGQTYLYSADPYYFFRLARNLVDFGMLGDSKALYGNEFKDSLRFFPFGDSPGNTIFPYVLFYFFKFSKFFVSSVSLLSAIFYFPVFIGTLSVLIIFLIARKLSNDFGAFITAFLFSIHSVFLFWNYAGYADTQILAQFWSLLSFLLFFYVIDFSKKLMAFSSFIGLLVLIYFSNLVWAGLFFVPVLLVCFIIALVCVYIVRKAIFDKKKSYFVLLLLIAVIGSFTAYYLGSPYWERALNFISESKSSTLFPTAFSSVSELEGAKTFSRFVIALGGSFLVLMFFAELFFSVKNFKNGINKYSLFCFVWFVSMAVPAFKSSRFLFFVLPPFVLIAGKCLWRLMSGIEQLFKSILKLRISDFSAKIISLFVVLILVFFIVNSNPFVAKTKLPLMTKSIADTANFIKSNSKSDSVIATAWDLGYLWQAFSKRATFFDGGLFNTERLYWTSKMLSSTNENISVNSLRIMSCGYDYLNVRSLLSNWAMFPDKIDLFNKFLGSNDKNIANELKIHLNDVYCNKSNDVFVVITDNMLYQISNFDYYSSWDFRKASMRSSIKGLSQNNAVAVLESKYNLSREDAKKEFFDAESFTDEIVPKHVDRISDCNLADDKLSCQNGFVVDTLNFNATYQGIHPQSLIFVNKDQKKIVVNYKDSPVNFTMVVYMQGEDYRSTLLDTELTSKLLVRMFIGEKLDNFDLVFTSQETPDRIVVYKLKQNK